MKKVNVIGVDEIKTKEKNSFDEDTKANENQSKISLVFMNFISLLSFSGLVLLSWLSLIWLDKYHFVFTFFRYDKSDSKTMKYFPIQVNSFFLYAIIAFTILSITITYIYYIGYIIYNRSFDIWSDKNKNYIIPISLNLFLFYIGELTHNKGDIFHIYYFIGFGSSIISIFYFIKLYYDSDFIENEYFDFTDYIKNTLIYEFFYGTLISLDLYYLFYVSCQIILYLIESSHLLIFMGIVVNFFMGLVGIYISFKLKNMVISLLFGIIYNGILVFHFDFSEKERKTFNLSSFEVVFSAFFIIVFLIELIYIFIYKRSKNYYK